MKTFNDNAGRTWSVSLNIDAIKRVRALATVDLLEAVGGKVIDRLVDDPVLLCDVLYAVCKAEADAKNVSDEAFGRAISGDAIDAATTALLEELVDFFPQAKRRILGKVVGKIKALQARVLEVAELRLDGPELENAMAEALTGFGPGSGSLPESPESTPAP